MKYLLILEIINHPKGLTQDISFRKSIINKIPVLRGEVTELFSYNDSFNVCLGRFIFILNELERRMYVSDVVNNIFRNLMTQI